MQHIVSFDSNPHMRLNILNGEWILVSAHRTKQRWQRKIEDVAPEMYVAQITAVVNLWQHEFLSSAENEWVKYIQIFENKAEIIGCSNPHPHRQIWAQGDIPLKIVKETERQKNYYAN